MKGRTSWCVGSLALAALIAPPAGAEPEGSDADFDTGYVAATTAADMRGPWRFSFMSLPVLAMLFAAGRERRRERG